MAPIERIASGEITRGRRLALLKHAWTGDCPDLSGDRWVAIWENRPPVDLGNALTAGIRIPGWSRNRPRSGGHRLAA